MNKFFEWMEKYFVPVAAKIGSQRHLVAIRDGFATLTPMIMAGAFATLLNNLGWKPYQNFMAAILPETWKNFGGDIWNAGFAFMAVFIVFTVSYHLARGYEKDGLSAAVISTAAALMLYKTVPEGLPLGYLGTSGLFISLIVAIIATEIFVKLIGNPKLVIKMPDGVPPAVAKSFAALLPSIIVLVIAAAVKELFIHFGINSVHEALFFTLQKPLQGVVGSIGGVVLIILCQQLLWFFGLHGSNILAPIINAFLLPLTLANTEAFSKGAEIPNILSSQFIDTYVNMGGSGTTLGLLIAIYLIGRKKSPEQKIIANLGIAPGCFNINEPVIFGMPIVLNPMYFIPFILVPPIMCLVAYGLTVIGFLPRVCVLAGWTAPPILSGIVSTNSIMGGVGAAICLALSILIYLPFVIVDARQSRKVVEGQGQTLGL